MAKSLSPAEQLTEFLNFVDQCASEYNYAYEKVGEEEKQSEQINAEE